KAETPPVCARDVVASSFPDTAQPLPNTFAARGNFAPRQPSYPDRPWKTLMQTALSLLLLLMLMATSVHAQAPGEEAQPAGGDVRDLGVFVVSGVQPGPGLWKVRRGDHTLHILGTVSPLPRDMAWRSDDVVVVLDQVDAVL